MHAAIAITQGVDAASEGDDDDPEEEVWDRNP
jgi:hypothetical protein